VEKLKELLGRITEKRIEIWKAVRVKNKESLEIISEFDVDAFLLDAYVEGSYGGAGAVFDWQLAADVAAGHERIILAVVLIRKCQDGSGKGKTLWSRCQQRC